MVSSSLRQPNTSRYINLALYVVWLGLVLWVTIDHVLWRDEVRAFSLTMQGDNIIGMLKAVHGEGHPAIWYVLLRGLHVLVPSPVVLKIAAFMVAAATGYVLVFLSPFSRWIVLLLLAGDVFLFEYSVIARNYGISALMMFLFAAAYNRHRERGYVLGIILFLMANCHVLAAMLSGAYLFFWFTDIMTGDLARRWQRFKVFGANAALATVGVILCFLTVYPPVNDAAANVVPGFLSGNLVMDALFAVPMYSLLSYPLEYPSHYLAHYLPFYIIYILPFFIIFSSTLGLIKRPVAWLTSVLALFGVSLFFAFVYLAYYRHAAIWLVFLISLYWIVSASDWEWKFPVRIERWIKLVSTIGWGFFILLLMLEVPKGIRDAYAGLNGPPFSRSRDLAQLILSRPELKDAIIVASPDYLLDTLPYYLSNPTYIMREHRFGTYFLITKKAQLDLSLGDILESAGSLHRQTGKPVVILIDRNMTTSMRVDGLRAPQTYKEGQFYRFLTTPEQIKAFIAATRLIQSFPPADGDESYDVYLLN